MKKKKILIIIITIIFLFFIGLVIILTNKNKKNDQIIQDDNADYDRVMDIINNEKEAIIYYYDSKSTDSIGTDIKDYLDKEKIQYYIYDAANVNDEEYQKLMEALEIDGEVFGEPAIIYIFSGKVYSNIININDLEVVKHYVEDNELTNVKMDNDGNNNNEL